MKKGLFFVILLLSLFMMNVNAKVLKYEDQEEIFQVKEGDYVCGLGGYFYGLFAYNYVGEEIKYVGSSYPEWLSSDEEIFEGTDYYQSHYYIGCFAVKKNVIYEDAPGGVPSTDSFIVYKEDWYEGKASIVPYFKPEVDIKCDKNSLKFGEKSDCSLSYTANYRLLFTSDYDEFGDEGNALKSFEPACIEKATFKFTDTNFKVTNYSSNFDVDVDGINYNLTSKTSECGDERTVEIMKFTVTPSSKEVAGVSLNISADDLIVTDVLGSNNFNPATNISVVKELAEPKKENPETSSTSIIIAVIVGLVSLMLMFLAYRKTTFKKIS